MPDDRDPKYVPLWVPPDAAVQPMMDKQGGYHADKAPPPPISLGASLAGAARPNVGQRPPVTPEVAAQAIAKLKEGAPKKKKEKKLTDEELMMKAKEMYSDIEARNSSMAAQPVAAAPALQRMRSPEDESVADRLYRESAHWKGPSQ